MADKDWHGIEAKEIWSGYEKKKHNIEDLTHEWKEEDTLFEEDLDGKNS